MKPEGILSGYQALDLTGPKGYVAGKILASMGVDIIKIEPPGGDPGRKKIVDSNDSGSNNQNVGWLVNNTGKRGITLNLECAEGKQLLLRLLEKADIILESYQPGYLDGLGLGYDDLSRIKPEIIMTSVTVFGQKGPYSRFKGEELVASAMGGALMTNGYPDRPPVKEALDANLYHANAVAVLGTMLALHARQAGGQGQHVDVASQEVSSTRSMTGKIVYQFDNRLIKRSGDRHQMGLHSARWIWQCKDGYLWFNLMGGKVGAPANLALTQWIDDDGLENPLKEMGDWKRFDRSTLDPEVRKRLEAAMDRFFRNHTKKEIAEEGMRRGVTACVANTPAELLDNPQLQARNFWGAFEDPSQGGKPLRYPIRFFHASETENKLTRGAPGIGEHNVEIYQGELGISMEEIQGLQSKGII